MNLTVQLSDGDAARLQARAGALGVTAEDLTRSMISDLLDEPDDEFKRVAESVLERNKELYRRLS